MMTKDEVNVSLFDEVKRLRKLNAEKDNRIAELEKQLDGIQHLAEERRLFIINGEDLGYIQKPKSENDRAYYTFIRCSLDDDYAIKQLREQVKE